MAAALDSLIIEPPHQATASVIWLHGLGADGHDFESLVPELGLVERGARFVLPHAPYRRVTVNEGQRMRAWYDILRTDIDRHADEDGVRASVAAVGALIDAEIDRGIPSQRVLLAGFSQGAAIALQTGLTFPQELGGILALSGYLVLPDALDSELQDANRRTPIFMAHGREDAVVPFALGALSRDRLAAVGCLLEFHAYPMPHTLCLEEVADIRRWLTGRLFG